MNHDEKVKSIVSSFSSTGSLKSRESNTVEFKEAFNKGNTAKYAKTMAAFSNNRGGYIIFGVKDNPRTVVGLSNSNFDNLNQEQFTEAINSLFAPAVEWECGIIEVNVPISSEEYEVKKIGWIYCEEALEKPIIAQKANEGEKIASGDVYYRYRARTQKIKYAEMARIIEERSKKERESLLKLIEVIRKSDTANLGIVNYSNGKLSTPYGVDVSFDRKLVAQVLKKAKFIKEGSFNETDDSFAKGLQTELAEAVADRPNKVTQELFVDHLVVDAQGNEFMITSEVASAIHYDLILNGYINKLGELTDKYYEDKANGEVKIAEEAKGFENEVIGIIDSIYDSKAMQPENARSNNVELQVDDEKIAMPEFKALWSKINSKSVYVVDFDTDELIRKSIASLDSKLRVSKIFFRVESGAMDSIKSKEDLTSGESFVKEESGSYGVTIEANSNVKYDLIGKLVDETGLTRKAIIAILQGIQPSVFNQFKDNPEEFISKAAQLINDQKATAIIEHITYDVLDEKYGTEIFTEPTIKGRLGVNAMKAKKHLYDHIVYDSTNERDFATDLDTNSDVAVYVKLPDGFYISTPVGHYNPDWAIAFYEGNVKHIYFVAETKGSMNSMQLRLIEESKIHCAREHFKAISNGNVVYDVVDSYKSLLEKVMK